ncbi:MULTISPECIES: hypothetical protein [Streptomyces]|uniref:Uncharacterized protein n=1 Tax=Streptomyces chengmaiensis TaxID=3040919 RepID=A0ABT6HLR2_9ACTN|nr:MULTISPECIES: hypothetical protein [Streptomyces]MDH2389633.1 hypothetical protein [Streptomyces chengmaiensis]WRQ82856.1 hypothetical protein I3F59_027870 [Streptomyces sp. MUM 178J]
MSARHARPRATTSDPLGLFLSWLWAAGTVAGFVSVAAAVDSELGDQDAIGPTLTVPDAAGSPAA